VTDEVKPKRGRGRPRGSGTGGYTLTPRHQRFVERYLACGNAGQAAAETGFAPSGVSRLLRRPAVAAAIAAARKTVQTKAEYGLEAFIEELDDGAAFARETGNATALARFRELKGKAHGLLIEKIDQRVSSGFRICIAGIDDEQPPPAALPPPMDAEFNVVQPAETHSKIFDDD
jgi:hypothetical protein